MRVRFNSTATVASDRRATSHTRFTDTRESCYTLAGKSSFPFDSDSQDARAEVANLKKHAKNLIIKKEIYGHKMNLQ